MNLLLILSQKSVTKRVFELSPRIGGQPTRALSSIVLGPHVETSRFSSSCSPRGRGRWEIPGRPPEIKGLADVDKIVKEFWNQINNPQKVSCNLLSTKNVRPFDAGGATLLFITVPRASRKDKPVYVGSNPLTGTYRRQNDGDYRCPPEVVQRMLAEKMSDTLDARIWNHYSLEDVDTGTLAAYRRMFANRTPVHPFNEMSNLLRMGVSGLEKTGIPGRFQPFANLSRLADDIPSSRRRSRGGNEFVRRTLSEPSVSRTVGRCHRIRGGGSEPRPVDGVVQGAPSRCFSRAPESRAKRFSGIGRPWPRNRVLAGRIPSRRVFVFR